MVKQASTGIVDPSVTRTLNLPNPFLLPISEGETSHSRTSVKVYHRLTGGSKMWSRLCIPLPSTSLPRPTFQLTSHSNTICNPINPHWWFLDSWISRWSVSGMSH